MYLNSINNFRALAIVLIVMGHSYVYGFMSDSAESVILKNIITGGTALFVFISGFMFHHVFYQRFNYKRFILNKIKNVLVPYIILSTIFILLLFISLDGFFNPENMIDEKTIFNGQDSSVLITFKYYLSGRFLIAYWYIPFVMCMFLVSNYHYKFVKINIQLKAIIIVFFCFVSIFIHRPIENTNAFHSLVYYTPIYLIGIFFSVHKNHALEFIKDKQILLLFIVISFSFLQYLTGHDGNYHKPAFEYKGVDLMFIQKIFLCFLIYSLLERFQFQNIIISKISETSFAIFFIHPWVLKLFTKLGLENVFFEYGFVGYSLTCIIVILTSVFLALSFKFITSNSKATRYFIGY